jgi:hypothetical protein
MIRYYSTERNFQRLVNWILSNLITNCILYKSYQINIQCYKNSGEILLFYVILSSQIKNGTRDNDGIYTLTSLSS